MYVSVLQFVMAVPLSNYPASPKLPNFTDIVTVFHILFQENILHLKISVDNVAFMYELNSSQDLIKDIDALLSSKDFVCYFALKVVQAAHIAVLHD